MLIKMELAQSIVNQMMKVVDYNINIMDKDGTIIASGDSSRLFKLHPGAIEAINLKREKVIYVTDVMNGSKPGVNLPIEFNEEVIGVVGITGDPTQIYKLSHIVKITVESLLIQQYLSDKLRYTQKAIEQWVRDLTNLDFQKDNDLEVRSGLLKIDVRTKCSILLIEIAELKQQEENAHRLSFDQMQQQETRLMQLISLIHPHSLFSVYLGKGLIISALPLNVKDQGEKVLQTAQNVHQKLKKEGLHARIGIGESYSGISGYRQSYIEALQCIQVMTKLEPDRSVSQISEWGVIRFISKFSDEVRESLLKSVTENKEPLDPDLQHTLETFLSCNQDISATASKLHIHRNTLFYRLDKVKQLWGLDPRKFQDALILQLACWCMKLR